MTNNQNGPEEYLDACLAEHPFSQPILASKLKPGQRKTVSVDVEVDWDDYELFCRRRNLRFDGSNSESVLAYIIELNRMEREASLPHNPKQLVPTYEVVMEIGEIDE